METIDIKPYSNNKIIALFQKIARWWLSIWYAFSDKHPKLSALLYKISFFFIFSMAVTLWQFLIMVFLPYAFESIWNVPFCFPRISLGLKDALGNDLYFGIFNEPVQILINDKLSQAYTVQDVDALLSQGGVIKVGGLGNFIAFEIAVFTAQCINFPLQRNITYKSKGNPYFQAFMYFVGWIFVSLFTNALWGIANPLLLSWQVNDVVISLLKTVLTGGVSMFIFFFIFLLIFPDLNKTAAKASKKYQKAESKNIDEKKKNLLYNKMVDSKCKADVENARLKAIQCESLYNGKAISYHSYLNKANNTKLSEEEKKELNEIISKKYDEAIKAKENMLLAKNEYEKMQS